MFEPAVPLPFSFELWQWTNKQKREPYPKETRHETVISTAPISQPMSGAQWPTTPQKAKTFLPKESPHTHRCVIPHRRGLVQSAICRNQKAFSFIFPTRPSTTTYDPTEWSYGPRNEADKKEIKLVWSNSDREPSLQPNAFDIMESPVISSRQRDYPQQLRTWQSGIMIMAQKARLARWRLMWYTP